MKHIILVVLLIQLAHTSSLTLKEVLDSANSNSTLTQALEQERLLLEARNLADTSLDPIELFGSAANADPFIGKDEFEYSIGLEKEFSWGNTQKEEQRITRLNNEAYFLEEDKKILNFENGLKSLYHNHCLDNKYFKVSRQNYQAFVKLYKKKQKAYKYQEISKAELMQLEIEKNRLYAKLQEIEMTQLISKQKLFVLGRLNNDNTTTLSCKDIYPIGENVKLDVDRFQLSQEAHTKRLESTQAALDRYSRSLDSISLSAQYDKEIDIDRIGIGITIPLSFTSNRSEQERAAAMYKSSALGFKHEQTMLEKRSKLLEMRSYLKTKARMLKTLRNNHRNYKKQLLPLIKKSYDLGETSVIEYLLNRQKSYQLRQEIYATKKAYYNTLFQLYALSELKDK
ncbi:TolC family protein [Sulfurovum sp.]|uniref:TolC family protein n=1 Tax=Sulfurovum sp. TaxID=1969726 RepID=UPI002868233B|nr:TolC family protein [Sulfurovum sp.]